MNMSLDGSTKHPGAVLMRHTCVSGSQIMRGLVVTRTWDLNTLQLSCIARKCQMHKVKSNWNSQKSEGVFQRKPLECRGHEEEVQSELEAKRSHSILGEDNISN